MGFLANMAAKSEMRVRDQILPLLARARPDFRARPLMLPCHIVDEPHNGFLLELQDGPVGIYRCQLHWWARSLSEELRDGLSGPGWERWMPVVGASTPVTDLGRLTSPEMFAMELSSFMH